MGPTKTEILERLQKLPNSLQEADIIVKDVLPHLSSSDVSLREVVEALGPSLTHTSPSERGAGTRLLADILHALPHSKLSKEELNFLVSFFVDRLKDHHSVLPSVFYANLALVSQERISSEDVRKLVEGLFREVQCQSHIMADRRNIYTFLKYCLIHKIDDLQSLGSDFTLGLVSAVDGERDPRNLVMVFSMVPLVAGHLTVKPFDEDLFEVVAAYFPIDFVPPASDPYGICQEDLVIGLRRALSSTPLFAKYCLPLLQEKLDSDMVSAKLDALHTLVSCCEVYSSEDIRPHVTPLWHSIRREVTDGSSAEVEGASLSSLTATLTTLGRSPVSQDARQALQSMVQSALAECVVHLRNPEQRLMFPSARLLLSIMTSGQSPAATITDTVLPLLADQAGSAVEELAQRNTIIILGKFLGAATTFPELMIDSGSVGKHEEVWFSALSQALSRPSVSGAALAALTSALPALSPARLPAAASGLTTILLETQTEEKLREPVVECLAALGRLHPSTILDHVLPTLLSQLNNESGEERQCWRESQVLDTLAALVLTPTLLTHVLPLLWTRVKASGEHTIKERAVRYLACVRKILAGTLLDPACRGYVLSEWRGTRQTVEVALGVILGGQQSVGISTLLGELSAILRLLVAAESDPPKLVEDVVNMVAGGRASEPGEELSQILATHPQAQCLLTNGLAGDNTSHKARYLVYVLEGLLLGVRSVPESTVGVLGQLRAMGTSRGTKEEDVTQVAAILHAVIINKLPQGPSLSQVLEDTWKDLGRRLDDESGPEEERQTALDLTVWTCKAVVVRGASEQINWSNRLLDLLSDPTLGMAAARSFGTIVTDHPYAFTPQTHTKMRLLYKQRFFESVVGPLVSKFNTTEDPNVKSCALVALASLLPQLPHIVLTAHIKKLLPVLLQGLSTTVSNKESEGEMRIEARNDGSESERRESTLATLSSLLQQNPAPAEPHIGTLIAALLPLTSQHTLTVRVKSLECLAALTSLPLTVILPYREEVVRGLRAALDDKKRVVRREATHTRCLWVLVGAPGGP